jgi:hypothetical protein
MDIAATGVGTDSSLAGVNVGQGRSVPWVIC